MSIKVCPKCKKSNAPSNGSCVSCGMTILYTPLKPEKRPRKIFQEMVNRLFSTVLLGGAVVSVFIVIMAIAKRPEFLALF